jgi:hypothetical protein
MGSLGLRPSFSHLVGQEAEAARSRVAAAASADARCEVMGFPGFVCLRVPECERRFWSPRLHLSFESHADGGTVIHGTYGPNANMWSSFLYGYLLVGSVALFSGILGWCQARLGMQAWALWVFWTMAAAAVAMYALARLGRKLGSAQTATLHAIYQKAIGVEVELE